MFILKHLKTLQHVSIIIQIVFRKLVYSLIKSPILKFVKNVKRKCCDAAWARRTLHTHRRFKITLPNTDQAHETYL